MGYNTTFEGTLYFKDPLTRQQEAVLNTILGEDCRDNPEWDAPDCYYIDLEINKAKDGIRWNGSEKTYEMPACVNVILKEMRKLWPEFSLEGKMLAQGEELENRWVLNVEHGKFATEEKIVVAGKKVQCPHCEEYFILEDSK